MWIGVGFAHVARVGHVDSETSLAFWALDASRAVTPVRREASSSKDGVCVFLVALLGDTGYPRAPRCPGEQAHAPRGGKGRDGEGCVEFVSLEHHVL